MNFTWYLHITPGHITTYKQLNFLFNYSNIRWESESERKRMTKTKKDFIFIWWCRNKCTDKKNVFIQSITNTFYETMKKKSFTQKFIFKIAKFKT